MKKTFYTELSYVMGIIILALGTAFTEHADFGLSMIVAPAYLLHLKISQFLPFFSFGMAEYTFQAFLIIVLSFILRKFKKSYLFSFVTAVIYGLTLDGAMSMVGLLPADMMWVKIVYFIAGTLLCTLGIAFFFHTYISPEAYELFVKEIAVKLNVDMSKFKIIYDYSSCIVGILLSFIFFGFGHFEGIKLGSIISTLFNGLLIGMFSKILEHFLEFKDGLPWRKYFEK